MLPILFSNALLAYKLVQSAEPAAGVGESGSSNSMGAMWSIEVQA
jgi:hypothetical protein